MDVDMIIESLKESLQSLEDIKTEVAEEQEEIRKTIALIQAMGELYGTELECEGCRRSFPEDELTETEFGCLCPDCLRNRMEIEDRNINE